MDVCRCGVESADTPSLRLPHPRPLSVAGEGSPAGRRTASCQAHLRRFTAAIACITVLLLTTIATAQETPAYPVMKGLPQKVGQPFYSGGILPTPQLAEYSDAYFEMVDGPGQKWRTTVHMDYTGPARKLINELLRDRFWQFTRWFGDVDCDMSVVSQRPIVFALAGTEAASTYLQAYGLADKASLLQPQGYILSVRENGVLCVGADDQGMLNGAASLIQLIHPRMHSLVARCAEIVDWPTFQVRYTAEYRLPDRDFLKWMMLYKINGFGACYRGMRWEGLTEEHRVGLKTIGEFIREYNTCHFMLQFHITGRGGGVLNIADRTHVETLLRTIAETMALCPTQHVMICADDIAPILTAEEAALYEHPAQAHAVLMEYVYQTVKRLDPDCVVSYCGPFYQGLQHRKWAEGSPSREAGMTFMEYLRQWANKDIRIVWTGPVTESLSITAEDIAAYKGLIGEERQLVYWDNTWHYHQPLRNFHARYLPGFVDHCADATSYININGMGPIGKFFSTTANDYYWNPEAFDSVRSRRHAVAQFMGPNAVDAAEALYALRGDTYMVVFQSIVDLKAFDAAVAGLEKVSWNRELADYCRASYAEVVKQRGR